VTKPKNIGTKTGTNIFRSMSEAIRYYQKQNFRPSDVRQKWIDAEIEIQAHPKGHGEWDKDGRWWKFEKIQVHSKRKKR